MLVDTTMVLAYLTASLVCILGASLFRKSEIDLSYDYLVLTLYESDVEADIVKSEIFGRGELSDFSALNSIVFLFLLVSNLWGLVDAQTLSLLATAIMSLSWLLLRFIDVLLMFSYS